MKATLQFTLPEEQEELDLALKASSLAAAIFEVRQQVFRPARKHGYSDARIQEIINNSEEAAELVGLLEELFSQVLAEYDVTHVS